MLQSLSKTCRNLSTVYFCFNAWETRHRLFGNFPMLYQTTDKRSYHMLARKQNRTNHHFTNGQSPGFNAIRLRYTAIISCQLFSNRKNKIKYILIWRISCKVNLFLTTPTILVRQANAVKYFIRAQLISVFKISCIRVHARSKMNNITGKRKQNDVFLHQKNSVQHQLIY